MHTYVTMATYQTDKADDNVEKARGFQWKKKQKTLLHGVR